MGNRRATIKQYDLDRYAKAMQRAGYTGWQLEVENADGTRHRLTVSDQDAPKSPKGPNPCDRLLNG